MALRESMSRLSCWEGYEVEEEWDEVRGRQRWCVIRLSPIRGRVAPILHVARFFGLDWKTVKVCDYASLQQQLGPVDLDGITVIALDEFAIQKGHRSVGIQGLLTLTLAGVV